MMLMIALALLSPFQDHEAQERPGPAGSLPGEECHHVTAGALL